MRKNYVIKTNNIFKIITYTNDLKFEYEIL